MKRIVFIVLSVMILFSCNKEDEISKKKTYDLSGLAQKGPFLKGSDVSIIELDNDLNPTGKIYNSTIEDNSGYFSIPEIELESNYIQIKVEGGYYNEIIGEINSADEIILYSISDISKSSTLNVNLLTHLIQARTTALMKEDINFTEAKNQAYDEILNIFHIENEDLIEPEKMDLTSSEISGGILLMISSIVQNDINSGMSFMEYLTSLTVDYKDNGEIDTENIRKTIASSALVLDLNKVVDNLIKKYSELGKNINPNSAISMLKNFNEKTEFPTYFDGIFPAEHNNSKNLISQKDTIVINKSESYSISINLEQDPNLSNIQVLVTSTSENYSTSGVEWFEDGNSKRILKNFDGTMLTIPFLFEESGSLTINLFIVTASGMVEYPKKVIIWN